MRDTLGTDPDTAAAQMMRPVLTLPAHAHVHDALTTMRGRRNQFALVEDDGQVIGLVTMQDLLDRLLPDPHTLQATAAQLRREDPA